MSGGFVADHGHLGWVPFRDHDADKPIEDRDVVYGCEPERNERDNPFAPLEVKDPEDTTGDAGGWTRWNPIPGERPCATWQQGYPVENVTAGAGTRTRNQNAQGWTPLRKPGEKDTRFPGQDPGSYPASVVGFPGGWPGYLQAGTEEYSQEEVLIPGFAGLVAVNLAGNPKLGTHVYDLDPSNNLHQTRWRELQSIFQVLDLGNSTGCGGGGKVIGVQLGPTRSEGRPGFLWAVNNKTREVGSLSMDGGGPLALSNGPCPHTFGKDADGNRRTVGHLHNNTLFAAPYGDGPLLFSGLPYIPVEEDNGPFWKRAHLRFNRELFHQVCGQLFPGVWDWEVNLPITLIPIETGDPKEKPPWIYIPNPWWPVTPRPPTGGVPGGGRPVTGGGGPGGGITAPGGDPPGGVFPLGDVAGGPAIGPVDVAIPGLPTGGVELEGGGIAFPLGDDVPGGPDLVPAGGVAFPLEDIGGPAIGGTDYPGTAGGWGEPQAETGVQPGTVGGQTPLNDHAGAYTPLFAHLLNCLHLSCFHLICWPTAGGEYDLTGAGATPPGGYLENMIADSPRGGGFAGIALGDGSLGGFVAGEAGTRVGGGLVGDTGMVVLPFGVNLGDLLAGTYDPCGDDETPPATTAAIFSPNVASLVFATPQQSTTQLHGAGTGIRGTDCGETTWEAIDSSGAYDGANYIALSGSGVEIVGDSITLNGTDASSLSSASAIGGSGADGATTYSSSSQRGSVLNATTLTVNSSVQLYPAVNRALVLKATDDVSFGASSVIGRNGNQVEST